ncbi:MAG: glycosyltransferase family protein [Alphaproteobacteria bacterium]
MDGGQSTRILIYSHDSFGLGHLRRCRAIAHALVERNKHMSALILSGSPIIGSFDFRARVDFVRIPGVIKLRNGEYTSLSQLVDTQQTLAMRESIIRHTADIYDPHLMLVDKEPLGLRGEVKPTLEMLAERGCKLVLGLRDIMDDPRMLATEWKRKHVVPALERLFDEIWVYGMPQICDPLAGVAVSAAVREKTHFTGYLRRELPTGLSDEYYSDDGNRPPYVLVTTGGGGDGDEVIDWAIGAYEAQPELVPKAVFVLGPFMQPELRAGFQERIGRLPGLEVITFDARIEALIDGAVGIVGMGGYNTFCEVLSFDKPAVLVPRTRPRMEQFIRAERAQRLGLVRMLAAEQAGDPALMADAIRALPQQSRPSAVMIPGLLDGLDSLNGRLHAILGLAEDEDERAAAGAIRRVGG